MTDVLLSAGILQHVEEEDVGNGVKWWRVRGLDCEITLEPRPFHCDRGNYIAKLHARGSLAMEIDSADGWPRYYFDRDRAFQEIEAWLVKRGQAVTPA